MAKTRTREDIIEELTELQEELFKYDEDEEFEEELEEYRENIRKFNKILSIMKDELGFTTEQCFELIKMGMTNNGK